jgi:squalene-associated FAD-dependent desaturase
VTGRHVAVIGGGLAGITAAIGLREAGFEVTMLEARPRLGGAATSFPRGDLVIDNGQHVFLRCCAAYQDLLARLGVAGLVRVQQRFDVTVLSPAGPDGASRRPVPGVRTARLRRTGLPGPLHLTRALAGYPLLAPAERIRVVRAVLALRRVDAAGRAADEVRLGEWLAARGQTERIRRMLWDLFIVSALNIAGDEASLALAATVIQTALLGGRDAADIGMARVPLGDLHDRAARAALGGLGVRVRLSARAETVQRAPGGAFAVQLAEHPSELVTADGVVLAVPPDQARALAGPLLAAARDWPGLGSSPIVNVHVVYDRPVTDLPFAAAVGSPVQWVFDKSLQAGLRMGQYLAISQSAADDYIDMPVAELRELFLPALERLLPSAASGTVTDFFVTRERRATFRQVPGTAALRPGSATSVPGLVLAGAWTDTGWPDTMEGAVRSGHNAAQELTRELAGTPVALAEAAR